MIRRRLVAAGAGLAVLFLAPQPLSAQDAEEADAGQMTELMKTVSGLFQAEPLSAEQEARLPAAGAVVAVMMPEGFYAEMMSEIVDGMLTPMFGMFSGEAGALMVLQSRLAVAPETLEAMPAAQRIELASLLDPAFEQRGAVVGEMMRDVMADAAVIIEPLYRDGLTRAYAARFDATQLADIGTFFATPSGRAFATQNMKVMADPQVMSASMQAMPAMIGQMGDITAQIEARMAALPAEKTWSDLSPAERRRMAELLGIGEADLEPLVQDPRSPPTVGL